MLHCKLSRWTWSSYSMTLAGFRANITSYLYYFAQRSFKARMPNSLWQFLSYLKKVWLVDNCYDIYVISLDCIVRWKAHDKDVTTKMLVGKGHLNILEIVKIFKIKQALMEVSLAQLSGGAVHPHYSRKVL